MRFIQLVHTLSYGDAISGEVLALHEVLSAAGHICETYALNVHPKLKGRAKQFLATSAVSDLQTSGATIVLHYSLGSPMNAFYSAAIESRRVIIYHNLTPSHWFLGVNGRVVRDIDDGCRELPQLLQLSDIILADSHFNAEDLGRFDLEPADSRLKVLELPVHPERWNEPANSGIVQLLKSDPVHHLLHVGRLAPNKCVEDIIRIFYFFHHKFSPHSKLWLVGIDTDTELYSFSLKRLVHELRLDHAVYFTGSLADSELRAMYENCSFYLCMSEHEGFCLPLVEAMHFGLPVLAYNSSAVPETIGSGGLLVNEKRHAEIAAVVFQVLGDTQLTQQLIAAGKLRAAELASFETFTRNVLQFLTELTPSASQLSAQA
jgi:glycosyltransferase involved in cell wall biosynthesis